jgi:hypothetical protein
MGTACTSIPAEHINATSSEQTMEAACSSETLVPTYTLRYSVTNQERI